jgi:hypothetical protein
LKRFLLLGLIVFFFCGCECFCTNYTIVPAFIGFSKSQIDTVILKRFTPGGNFANLIDSAILSSDTINYHPYFYYVQGDTTLIFTYNDSIGPIQAGNDWQIYIPGTHTTINISNIENGSQVSCKGCPPNIISLVQNGTQVNSPSYTQTFTVFDGYRIYIRP